MGKEISWILRWAAVATLTAWIGSTAAGERPELVAGWRPGDADDAGVVADISGHGHDGRADKVGRRDGAGVFNGIDSYVEIPASPDFNLTGGFTVTARVRIDRISEDRGQSIVARSFELIEPAGWNFAWGYHTDVWWTQNLDHGMVGSASAGDWHHLTMVVSMGGYVVEFFVDGISSGRSIRTTPLEVNTQPLYLGRRGGGDFLKGEIEEVMIFDRPLAVNQVRALVERASVLPPAERPSPVPPPRKPTRPVGQIELAGNWRKPLPVAEENYYSWYVALVNRGTERWRPVRFWLDGQLCGGEFVELNGVPTLVRGVVPDPVEAAPGAVMQIAFKVIAADRLTGKYELTIEDVDGYLVRFPVDFAPMTERFEGAAVDADRRGGWIYLRGPAGVPVGQIDFLAGISGVSAPRIRAPERIPPSGLAPVRWDWAEAVPAGTPLLVRHNDLAFGWFRVYPTVFPIGIYRVHRSVVNGDWQPPPDREWLAGYAGDFAFRGRDTDFAPPDAWLEDCRRHLIDVIAPDYTEYHGDPARLAAFGQTAVPLAVPEQVARFKDSPDVSAWYGPDEPAAGIAPERFSAEIAAIRAADSTRPVWLTVNTPAFPRADLFECVDVGCLDYYPVPTVDLYATGKLLRDFGTMIAPRPLFLAPQAWRRGPDWPSPGWSRFPTPEEELYMVADGVAAGIRGVLYFSYNVEPTEPVEGVGVSRDPAARALWAEIGRINLMLRTLNPYLCVAAVLGDGEVTTKDRVRAISLAAAEDAVVVVVLNDDSASDLTGFRLNRKSGIRIRPLLLSGTAADYLAYRITPDGLEELSIEAGEIILPELGAAAFVVLVPAADEAAAKAAYTTLQQRFEHNRSILEKGDF